MLDLAADVLAIGKKRVHRVAFVLLSSALLIFFRVSLLRRQFQHEVLSGCHGSWLFSLHSTRVKGSFRLVERMASFRILSVSF